MLKALYDFQAVYPKTISFDEGEYFILYQTSARQRNWWQVVSMKGNIGFVPSNYVMKIKVEHDFLISFLNSSIESLEKCTDPEINGIMSKDELLDRLREKKNTMERLYAESWERDGDSSLSYSHSCSDKQQLSGSHNHSHRHSHSHTHPHQLHSHQSQGSNSPPAMQRLDMSKKSMSSPAVGGKMPHSMPESPSMGSMQQLQSSSCTIQTPQQQQQQQQQQQPLPAPPLVASTSAAAAAAQAQAQAQKVSASVSDVTQDNSITSEPSETTTTTTTTSEDVVTTYKETSQLSASNGATTTAAAATAAAAVATATTAAASGAAAASSSSAVAAASHKPHNGSSSTGATASHDEPLSLSLSQGADSAADKSEEASDDGCNGCIDAANNSVDNSQALDESIESPSLSHRLGAALAAGNGNGNGRGQLKVESSDVYQIVDALRRNTNLSFDLSCEALRVVLTSLEQLYNGAINPYLEAVAVHVTGKVATPKELLGITHDSKRLQYLFAQLADCKNDTEQRTWMLYEDEEDIMHFLEELVEILNNADENISCYEMSCDQYQMFINLVQYYQMETRWSIKHLLLKTFTAACHLDHIIVDILLTSVLPLEIVEDMKTHFANLDRFKQLVKMLTVIFSLGQLMPVNHQDYLGVHFASFLLEIVEGNNPELLVDMVIALILAFNQQFGEHTVNVIIEAMQNLPTGKVFTEKLLLLLNREDDPTRLLKHHNENMNTVLRMFIDIFSHADTAGMFYTNDIKVLIDIVVRQLSDLDAGSPTRPCYLELCRRILRNTNYQEHQHRKHDLMKIFTRIFCEETECSASDQQLVREIANEFPQLFKA
ncbi:NCK-interacting protein with SH3 domain [Drosophila grimshawi]|nr:NCK-interacting protein with SH3 domain [Drosophila grimshawi]